MTLVECWLAHCRAQGGQDKTTHAAMGEILSQLAVLRAMSLAVAGQLAQGRSPATEAALVKDLGTELEQRIPALIAQALGQAPECALPGSLLRTLAYLEQVSPTFSLRGGTREILRGIIARGLGLR